MLNYTKGEWKVQYCGQGLTNIILNNDNDDVIAIVDNSRDNHSPNDADLISQAPAMYEALKQAKEHLLMAGCKRDSYAVNNIESILSKLEGDK